MTPSELCAVAIDPALSLLPDKMNSPTARVFLVAIAIQESRAKYRAQIPSRYARGFWQFEKGGGVRGVMRHNATRRHAEHAVKVLSFDWDERELYEALEFNDALAGVFARLNLWWLPSAPPKNEDEGWEQYLDAWRPGKPHPGTWASAWAAGESVRVTNNDL